MYLTSRAEEKKNKNYVPHLDVMAPTCNPSTSMAEAGGLLRVESQLRLHNETQPQNRQTNTQTNKKSETLLPTNPPKVFSFWPFS